MANEITQTVGLAASKGGSVINPGTMTKLLTMTGDDMTQYTVTSATATATAFTWGSITGAPVAVMIKNLDATNYVEIAGTVDGTPALTGFKIKILAGVTILVGLSSATLYHQANGGACNLLVVAAKI